MKKLIVAAAVLAAVALPQSSPAESVCADAGASNPVRDVVTVPQPRFITTPTVCVWVP